MAGDPLRTLLVRLPNPLGDAVMALPLLAVLRDALPGARLLAAGAEGLAPLFAPPSSVDAFVPLARGRHRGWRALREQARQLRAARAEVVLLLPNSWSSALAARMAGIPQRVGRRGAGRACLLTHRLPPITGPAPMTEWYADFLAPLGIARPEPLPRATLRATRPPPEPMSTPSVDARGWLGVAPGAAFGPSKIYPETLLLDAVARACAAHALRPVWLGAPSETPLLQRLAAAFADRHGGPTLVVAGDLGVSIAALGACRAVLAMDNGARHLAAALGVPQAVIYGPTHPAWSAHALEQTVILRREELPCLGCHHKRCPLPGHPCMNDLAPAAVAAALGEALRRQKGNEAPGRGASF